MYERTQAEKIMNSEPLQRKKKKKKKKALEEHCKSIANN